MKYPLFTIVIGFICVSVGCKKEEVECIPEQGFLDCNGTTIASRYVGSWDGLYPMSAGKTITVESHDLLTLWFDNQFFGEIGKSQVTIPWQEVQDPTSSDCSEVYGYAELLDNVWCSDQSSTWNAKAFSIELFCVHAEDTLHTIERYANCD